MTDSSSRAEQRSELKGLIATASTASRQNRTRGNGGQAAGGLLTREELALEVRPNRPLPLVTEENKHFWRGDGHLRFLRCGDCGYWIHPPSPRCPRCQSVSVTVETASGFGTVFSFTINHHPWYPGFDPPYIIAIVNLAEQEDLRLTSNIVGCEPEEVEIGMEVEATFVHQEDIWVPLFKRADVSTALMDA